MEKGWVCKGGCFELKHFDLRFVQVYNDAQKRLPNQCRFFHVASDYYDWPYEQRARVMACPSTFHLCKSLVFENTKWKQDDTKPVDADRYWCVLVQYEGSVNITKLEKAIRERTGASRKGTHLRIAPAEVSNFLLVHICSAFRMSMLDLIFLAVPLSIEIARTDWIHHQWRQPCGYGTINNHTGHASGKYVCAGS